METREQLLLLPIKGMSRAKRGQQAGRVESNKYFNKTYFCNEHPQKTKNQ